MIARFIPAGAGNTYAKRETLGPLAVHPRGCGEHQAHACFARRKLGSSPRVRGTHREGRWHYPHYRFIPAGAGNTYQTLFIFLMCAVHPRGCGEHGTRRIRQTCSVGSSPRVRGTPPHQPEIPLAVRFIPAGAGNTHGQFTAATRNTVHPRGCGEHSFSIFICLLMAGSSPRVRGTPIRQTNYEIQKRFIPAGAGNTQSPLQKHPRPAVHPRGCGEHVWTLERYTA